MEGQEDTHFRLYRESNPALKHNTWRSLAGNIDELKLVATRLGEDGTQPSRRLHDRIIAGVPRFEASEEVRKSGPTKLHMPGLICRRKGSGENTGMLVKLNSCGLSLGILSTKGVHVESEFDTRFPMRRMGPRMVLQQDDHPGNLGYQHLRNLPGLLSLPAVDR